MKKIIPGKLTGQQAVKIIDTVVKFGPLKPSDVGISRMSMSHWRNGVSNPDAGSCLKIVDLLLCAGVPAVLVMPGRKFQ